MFVLKDLSNPFSSILGNNSIMFDLIWALRRIFPGVRNDRHFCLGYSRPMPSQCSTAAHTQLVVLCGAVRSTPKLPYQWEKNEHMI